MKFAAIDIGSNAVRLLFTQVLETKKKTVFKKDSLFRVPIRLGDEAFVHGEISKDKADSLKKTMLAFKYLIEAYKPVDYMACATAAMRESVNGMELVEKIREDTGLDIMIIDGKREAEIIYSNHIADNLDKARDYLYIDVGGGSTELTVISKTKIASSQSFNLGTVRLLKDKAKKSEWGRMKEWLEKNTKGFKSMDGIGSGGNINKIVKMAQVVEGDPLEYKAIRKIYKDLNSYTLMERIGELGLRPDRADVIIPATKIFLKVLKWADIDKIYVPQIGLADGIIHVLYEKQKLRKTVA